MLARQSFSCGIKLREAGRDCTLFNDILSVSTVKCCKWYEIRYGLCNKKVFVPDGLLLFKITENLLNLGSVCVEIRTSKFQNTSLNNLVFVTYFGISHHWTECVRYD